jgi:acylphosphatase
MYRLVIAYHIIVSGFVQGVGFRWFTQRHAESLGVGGWVRNLPDGRVEVFAQAEKDVLDAFCGKLRDGPSYGTTEALAIEKVPVDHKILGFQIRH